MYVKPYNIPPWGESRPKSRLITFQLEEGKKINALVGVDQPGDFIVPQEAWFNDRPRKKHFDTEFVAVYTNLEQVGKTKNLKPGLKILIVFILVEIVFLYFELRLLNLI